MASLDGLSRQSLVSFGTGGAEAGSMPAFAPMTTRIGQRQNAEAGPDHSGPVACRSVRVVPEDHLLRWIATGRLGEIAEDHAYLGRLQLD